MSSRSWSRQIRQLLEPACNFLLQMRAHCDQNEAEISDLVKLVQEIQRDMCEFLHFGRLGQSPISRQEVPSAAIIPPVSTPPQHGL